MPEDSTPFMFRAIQQDPVVFNNPANPSTKGMLMDMAYNAITPTVLKGLGINATQTVNPAPGVPYFDRWYAKNITTPAYNYSRDKALETVAPKHIDTLLQALVRLKVVAPQHADQYRDKLVSMSNTMPGKMLMQQLPSVQNELKLHDMLFKNRHLLEKGPLVAKYATIKVAPTAKISGGIAKTVQEIPPPPWMKTPVQPKSVTPPPPPPAATPPPAQPKQASEYDMNKRAQESLSPIEGMGRGSTRGMLAGGLLGLGTGAYTGARMVQDSSKMSNKDKIKFAIMTALAGGGAGAMAGGTTGAMLRPAMPQSQERESLVGSMGRGAMKGLIPGGILGAIGGGLRSGLNSYAHQDNFQDAAKRVAEGAMHGAASGGMAGAGLGALTRPMLT